jgi:predicted Rdx family selenoprotein
MRKNIIHPGSSELKYEIRDIVQAGRDFQKLGKKMI